MDKLQRNWGDVSRELNQAIEECKLRPKELASEASIDYFAARRALRSGVKNRTKVAVALCSYFEIDENKCKTGVNGNLLLAYEALDEVWDGTEVHAAFLRGLILSTGPYTIKSKRD